MAAALRPMMAVAREEVAMVTSEASVAARTTVSTEAAAAVRGAGHEMVNPLAVREAAELTAKRAVDAHPETNLPGLLSHVKSPQTPSTPTLTTSAANVNNSLLHEAASTLSHESRLELAETSTTVSSETVVGQILEADLGTTIKEAMTNGAETGAQDVAEQASEMAKAILDGRINVDQHVKVLKAGMPGPR